MSTHAMGLSLAQDLRFLKLVAAAERPASYAGPSIVGAEPLYHEHNATGRGNMTVWVRVLYANGHEETCGLVLPYSRTLPTKIADQGGRYIDRPGLAARVVAFLGERG